METLVSCSPFHVYKIDKMFKYVSLFPRYSDLFEKKELITGEREEGRRVLRVIENPVKKENSVGSGVHNLFSIQIFASVI